jgi:hypothetical protein
VAFMCLSRGRRGVGECGVSRRPSRRLPTDEDTPSYLAIGSSGSCASLWLVGRRYLSEGLMALVLGDVPEPQDTAPERITAGSG